MAFVHSELATDDGWLLADEIWIRSIWGGHDYWDISHDFILDFHEQCLWIQCDGECDDVFRLKIEVRPTRRDVRTWMAMFRPAKQLNTT